MYPNFGGITEFFWSISSWWSSPFTTVTCYWTCSNLTFSPSETWSSYTSLVKLELWNSCQGLTAFSLDGFPALQSIHIYGCRSLESIFLYERSLPRSSTIQWLSISRCKALPQQMDTLTALEHLSLYDLSEEHLSLYLFILWMRERNIGPTLLTYLS